MEFAGEVASVGDNVTNWKPGDRVFGITAGEAQAEFLLTDQSLLARIPENLSFTEAAGVPEVFITAHDAIFHPRPVEKKGETHNGIVMLLLLMTQFSCSVKRFGASTGMTETVSRPTQLGGNMKLRFRSS